MEKSISHDFLKIQPFQGKSEIISGKNRHNSKRHIYMSIGVSVKRRFKIIPNHSSTFSNFRPFTYTEGKRLRLMVWPLTTVTPNFYPYSGTSFQLAMVDTKKRHNSYAFGLFWAKLGQKFKKQTKSSKFTKDGIFEEIRIFRKFGNAIRPKGRKSLHALGLFLNFWPSLIQKKFAEGVAIVAFFHRSRRSLKTLFGRMKMER